MKETIRVCRFKADGRPMVDIRWWRNTNLGPRPTKKSIMLDQVLITRLIAALQVTHAEFNSEEAKTLAGKQS